jgi:hypothetical protein
MLNQGMYTPAPASSAIAIGRAKGGGTTYYTVPGCTLATVATRGMTANEDAYAPWLTPTPIVIDQLAAEVTVAAGTNFRIGFYAATTDWQPTGAPLADSGNLDASTTGIKTYTPGTPISVPAGRYVSIVNCDGAPSLRAYRGNPNTGLDTALGATSIIVAQRVARTYGAFPTPGTAWTAIDVSSGGISHLVVYRVSTP